MSDVRHINTLDIMLHKIMSKIYSGKKKIKKLNWTITWWTLGETPLQNVEPYIYLGSNVDENEGTYGNNKIRTHKARGTFIPLGNLWK